jgi:hypothetical protein
MSLTPADIGLCVEQETSSKLHFVTRCRPYSDIEAEKWDRGINSDDDDEDDEEDEDIDIDEDAKTDDGDEDWEDIDKHGHPKIRSTHGTKDCMCDKPAAEHPDWTWIVSSEGDKVCRELVSESLKRNQDCYNMHIYNHFTAYGIGEVIDNWVR